MSLVQGLTGTLLWIGLSQLGNPASASRRSEEAAAHWLVLAKEKETEAKQEVSLLDDVLPSQLSRNAVVQQTLINAVLVSWVLEVGNLLNGFLNHPSKLSVKMYLGPMPCPVSKCWWTHFHCCLQSRPVSPNVVHLFVHPYDIMT